MMNHSYQRHPTNRRRCTVPSLVRWEASQVIKIILLKIALQQFCVESWTVYHPVTSRQQITTYRQRTFILNDVQVKELDMNQPENVSTSTTLANIEIKNNDENDDDDEYEYVEFDSLTEEEFIGSEWIVGTNWDRNPNKIDETWTRLIVDKDGKNVAVWGDDSKGTWTFDVPSQFLSISKENIFAGKQIWACTISDYYYLQGTVRGWTYWSAAAVIGQWQARRLGVDKDEAGTPPWFMETEEETSASEDERNNDTTTDMTAAT